MSVLKQESKEALSFLSGFVKWVLIALFTGAAGGLVGSAFNLSVRHATAFRAAHPWLLYLLPASGLVIVLIYRALHTENKNTNTIIDSIQLGDRVPLALVPTIYLGTVITHLFGGSAGREGAALQIGGGLGNFAGRLFHLDEKDMRIATLSGMSAVFSALFGTPLTATVFALEVISVGVLYYSAFVPCLVASLVALQISVLFGTLRHKNRAAAYAVSMLAFSVYHVWGYALDDPGYWIFLLQYLPAGWLLARCYERTNSIWGSVFFHMLTNALAVELYRAVLQGM